MTLWTSSSSLPIFQGPRRMFALFRRNVGVRGQPPHVFLNPAFQPHAPDGSGRLGFVVLPGATWTSEFEGVIRVIVKRRAGRWSYFGDYRYLRVRSLTSEEWNASSIEVCIVSTISKFLSDRGHLSGQNHVGKVFPIGEIEDHACPYRICKIHWL